MIFEDDEYEYPVGGPCGWMYARKKEKPAERLTEKQIQAVHSFKKSFNDLCPHQTEGEIQKAVAILVENLKASCPAEKHTHLAKDDNPNHLPSGSPNSTGGQFAPTGFGNSAELNHSDSTCHFTLNGRETSILSCPGIGDFPAFSGNGENTNRFDRTDVKEHGPLPEGKYYIVGRGSGGILSQLKNWVGYHIPYYGSTDRSHWFALFRDDGKIDDETFVNGVKREFIRLHPIGPQRLSDGCVTLYNQSDFDKLGQTLRDKGATIEIPGTSMKAYGTITVTH